MKIAVVKVLRWAHPSHPNSQRHIHSLPTPFSTARHMNVVVVVVLGARWREWEFWRLRWIHRSTKWAVYLRHKFMATSTVQTIPWKKIQLCPLRLRLLHIMKSVVDMYTTKHKHKPIFIIFLVQQNDAGGATLCQIYEKPRKRCTWCYNDCVNANWVFTPHTFKSTSKCHCSLWKLGMGLVQTRWINGIMDKLTFSWKLGFDKILAVIKERNKVELQVPL